MNEGPESICAAMHKEEERIRAVYAAENQKARNRPFFGYSGVYHLVRVQERHRETLRLFKASGYHPLVDRSILDVGCGDGHMLRMFVDWGATPERLSGVELRREAVEAARRMNPAVDVRHLSATELPYADGEFDLVCQHTVFTSVLKDPMKRRIAAEMDRVLRPGGAVLWYDFLFNNPYNRNVKGIGRQEIFTLFPGYAGTLTRITLAPPIHRRIPTPLLPTVYPLLGLLPFLRTHYLGLLCKPAR